MRMDARLAAVLISPDGDTYMSARVDGVCMISFMWKCVDCDDVMFASLLLFDADDAADDAA